MTTAQKHVARLWRRLQRVGRLRRSYASRRTAQKAAVAMQALGVPVHMTWVSHRTIEYEVEE